MGKLAVYKYMAMMFLVVQIIVSIFTIAGLYGGDVNPIGNAARALLVYILPILIIANMLLLVYWLVRRRWLFSLIPIVTLACCIPYSGTIFQFGFGNDKNSQQSGLTIASYNVAMFNRETSGFIAQDILAEMRRQNVDVLCMQEYNEISGDKKNSDSYKEYFPYMAVGRNDMVIYSRYPIMNQKTISFEETNNSAMWADIDIKGNEFRVFNVHMQTTGINRTLHQVNKFSKQNQEIDNNRVLKAIYGRMDTEYPDMTGLPVILCGDFNDVPYSYVYNTLLGDLVDGFKECGKGWMYTFRGKKAVRIDYIFHDKQFKGIDYYKTEITYSDHYPVFMRIAL